MNRRVLSYLWSAAAVAALAWIAIANTPAEEPPPPAAAAVTAPAPAPAPTSGELGTSYNLPEGALIAPGKAADLIVLHTGDVIGYVDTCGCPKNPAGGLARRAWVLEQLKSNYPGTPQALFDAGNFYDNPTPAGEIRTDALLEAMGQLGYLAINVGERELMLGYDEFVKRTAASKIPFVSTNIVRQDTKDPVFRPYVIVEVPRGEGKPPIKVGVVGIVRFNPLFLKAGPEKSNLVTAQPRDALRRQLPEVRRRSDVVVLLAGLHHDDARLLARDLGGIDLVLGAYGGYATAQEITENGARVVYVGNQGKYLSENRLFLSPETSRPATTVTYVHFLTSRYPDEEKMQKFVGGVMGRLNEGNAAERKKKEDAKAAAAARPYSGSEACKGCHAGAFTQWSETAHARAFETLVAKKHETDQQCVPCHVTGGSNPAGFQDLVATPELAGVGCESCHGPGTEHVNRPKRGYGKIELASCIGCHNHANSPLFDYYTFLPRVVHAQAKTSR